MQQFFIKGKIPGMNEMIAASKIRAGKFSKYAIMKKECEIKIMVAIKTGNIRSVESAYFEFIWCEVNKRRNKDNISAGQKMIFDQLVRSGIIRNDGWKEIIGMNHKFTVNKANPGVLVVMHGKDQQ